MMINEELERLLELDPVKAHDQIMRATRPPPVIVHKEYLGRQPALIDDTNGNGNGEQPPFSDEQIDIVAQALADLRSEFQDAVAPLTEQVAVLQGQVNVLLSLIGSIVGNNGNGKSIEASETKTTRRVRRTT
jgi:hypothetical protein